MANHDVAHTDEAPGQYEDPAAGSSVFFLLWGLLCVLVAGLLVEYMVFNEWNKLETVKAPSGGGPLTTRRAAEREELRQVVKSDRVHLTSGEVVELGVAELVGDKVVIRVGQHQVASYPKAEVKDVEAGAGRVVKIGLDRAVRLVAQEY